MHMKSYSHTKHNSFREAQQPRQNSTRLVDKPTTQRALRSVKGLLCTTHALMYQHAPGLAIPN
jgi:hypothetical protein